MPSKNEKQREALIIKKGITWVRAHGFDVIEGQGRPKAGHTTRRRRRR